MVDIPSRDSSFVLMEESDESSSDDSLERKPYNAYAEAQKKAGFMGYDVRFAYPGLNVTGRSNYATKLGGLFR